MLFNMKLKKIKSRYGVDRTINKHGKGWYTMEGHSDYIRVGMTEDNTEVAYIDPQGGPFLHVGDDFEKLGKIVSLIQEDSGKNEFFKIRIEVEQ
jgi:hypothetical protein